MLLGLALFLIASVVYLPSWNGEFLWDDNTSVTESEIVHDDAGWWKAWVAPPVSHPDYFPLTTTSYWMEWRLWERNPAGYRVTNILLHAACALLLWRLFLAMELPGAWWAAALFAVHPVNVESVAWIAERKNLLAMVFAVPCLAWLVRWHGGHGSNSRLYWAALALFFLALASKATVVGLPLVFLCYVWWRGGRLPRVCDLKSMVPFLVLAAGFALLVIAFQQDRAVGDWQIEMPGYFARLVGAAQDYWFYFGKALWPVDLTTVYPLWRLDRLSPWQVAVLAGTAILLPTLWFSGKPWMRTVAFGLTSYGLLLAPALGLVKMSFMRLSLVADHFQHLALPALVALVVCGATAGIKPTLRRALPALWGTVGAVLIVLTASRALLHANHEALWNDCLAKNPASAQPHIILGTICSERRDYPSAESHFRKAIELAPTDPIPCYNMGLLLRDTGDSKGSQHWLRKATKLGSANACIPLAAQAIQNGDLDAGLAILATGAARFPDNPEINSAAGASLLMAGRPQEALPFLETCERLLPENANVKLDLGKALHDLGRMTEAESKRQEALRLDPTLSVPSF